MKYTLENLDPNQYLHLVNEEAGAGHGGHIRHYKNGNTFFSRANTPVGIFMSPVNSIDDKSDKKIEKILESNIEAITAAMKQQSDSLTISSFLPAPGAGF